MMNLLIMLHKRHVRSFWPSVACRVEAVFIMMGDWAVGVFTRGVYLPI